MQILRLEHVGKNYFNNQVLCDISFSLNSGEILGLIGENGTGKSTLLNILFGMPEIFSTGGYDGKIFFNNKPVKFNSPEQAIKAGIGMVHQEFSLIPDFTSTENILLNREILNTTLLKYIFGKRTATLNKSEMNQKANEAMNKLGINIAPDMPVKKMSTGYKQFVETAREISKTNIKLLLLDEPTAVLTESEAEILITALQKLAHSGTAIIFTSHRLAEIKELCDRIIILRDGKMIKDSAVFGMSTKEIAAMMIGREKNLSQEIYTDDIKNFNQPENKTPNKIKNALKIEHLNVNMPGEIVRDISFEVKRGEIFGIGGLAGHGKLGISNGIMGLYPAKGKVKLSGKKLQLNKPRAALLNGAAFVSEDRRNIGLLLDEPLYLNIAFTAMSVKRDFLTGIPYIFQIRDENAMKNEAGKFIKALEIKCSSVEQKAGELSGGNQQKICLARAFVMKPEILFINEPTRGIDIGAKNLILKTLRKYNQDNGMTIIITSSELEELRNICNRIAIIYEGRIAGILPAAAPVEDFGLLMAGRYEKFN